jgi:4-hydroxy-3-methylbut-2-en-1-yl diphosphate reductase
MSKKLYISKPYGFCFGVKNALNIVEKVIISHPNNKIYVFNEIVHNKTIVNKLEKQNVFFTKNPKDIPDKSIVIFSAHGVSPLFRAQLQEKQAKIFDATCPLVQKVHDKVKKFSTLGYHIIYICQKNHDEAIGVIAENPHNISIVENITDIEKIQKGYEKYTILTQTTLNMFEVEKIFLAIKKSIPNVEFPEKKDLCFTTTTRQEATEKNSKKCDLFLVVGSANSSNSKKLQSIAKKNTNSYLIDTYMEIKNEWLEDANSIFLTSGASAPESLIIEIINFLCSEHGYIFVDEQSS